jgi:hypothetical protein
VSNDWDVRCLDCGVQHGFSDANHDDKLMIAVAKAGPALAALAGDPTVVALAKESCSCSTLRLALGHGPHAADLDWFATHGRHRLVAVDEYGYFDGDCGEWPIKSGPGQFQCRKPHGHSGDHSPDRPA